MAGVSNVLKNPLLFAGLTAGGYLVFNGNAATRSQIVDLGTTEVCAFDSCIPMEGWECIHGPHRFTDKCVPADLCCVAPELCC